MAVSSGQAADAGQLTLSAEVQARCLKVLREGMAVPEFWPSMHAAEGLSLAGHGDEVRAFLEPKLKTETDGRHLCGLAREMVRAGDRSKVSIMLGLLAKKDDYAHGHAAESLYKVGGIGDGSLLRKAFAEKTGRNRLMPAAALGKAGSPAAMAVLRKACADADKDTSRIASWVLARIGDKSDIPQLRKNVARFTDPFVRCYSEHALAMFGDPEGRKALIRNLGSDNASIRTYAATFAGEARMTEVADALVKMLDDKEIDPRVRAAQSLLVLARPAPPDRTEDIARDVYPATKANPRLTEGSVIELADGTLLFATTEFVGGGADAATAHIVARASRDGGRTWGPKRELQKNVGRHNVMSVTLRRLAAGGHDAPLGMFYLVKNSLADLKVYLRISTDQAKTFGEPIVVTAEPGYHVMNNDRVTRLSTGRLIVPVASSPDARKVNHYVSSCWFSDDGGRTWRHGRGRVDMPKRGAMEPEVIELRDGRVMMIVRTQLGIIGAAWSRDGGDTWSEPSPLTVKAPEAPATLRRIPATGDLLLVWNNNYEAGAGHSGSRSPLTAAISADEGRTWTHVRDIEPDRTKMFSYISLNFVQHRAVLSYYVRDKRGLSSRFRSLPVSWFYSK